MKNYLKSKTLWVNAFFLLIAFVQWYAKTSILDPEVQAGIVSITNIILRFKTKTQLTLN